MTRDVTGGLAFDLILIRVVTSSAGMYHVVAIAVKAYRDHASCSRKGVARIASRENPVAKAPPPTRFVKVRYSN